MKQVSIILQYNENLGYPDSELNKTIDTLMNQNHSDWEVILVDERGAQAPYPNIAKDDKIIHLPGSYANRAQALNAGIKKARGEYIMLVNNIGTQVTFRLSTLETFMMVADRNEDVGFVYSDYHLVDADGLEKDIHLLNYHIGRVRDNMDYGALLFFPKSTLNTLGGLNENYNAADLYDLRLRTATDFEIVHIEAARNGYTYIVKSAAKKHNVFDYLLAGKDVQLEMEQALTEHLKRIGAYLEPGSHYNTVRYKVDEEKKFEDCIASVVIPVFDRKEFIGTAIESVQAQTVQNVEVIIVCNGGADDPTIEGVKPYLPGGEKYDANKPQVKLLVEDVNNIGFCLNKGIAQARGKYYVQLDSDDRLKPDAVEKLIAVFDSDPNIGMVIGSYDVWEKNETTGEIIRKEDIPVVTHDEWTEENGRNNLLRINGAGAPRSAHIKVLQDLGGFGMNDTESCRNYGEDYDMVLRVSENHRIGRVWDPIYEVIRHSGGTDHSIDQATVDRNDNAKDNMRLEAIERRIDLNNS
ncbi:glycosyltransferase [candidate division KSB1 bacterium]|nr:glycosyltransferase [candidate division KSB1 bacterium]